MLISACSSDHAIDELKREVHACFGLINFLLEVPMKRQISILLHLLILLALSASRITCPSPTATTLSSRLPDPVVDS